MPRSPEVKGDPQCPAPRCPLRCGATPSVSRTCAPVTSWSWPVSRGASRPSTGGGRSSTTAGGWRGARPSTSVPTGCTGTGSPGRCCSSRRCGAASSASTGETRTWLVGLRRRRQRHARPGARGHARGRAARAPVVCRRAASVGAVDAARHLLGDPPALRDLPGEAVQRARRRPSRRRCPRDVPRRGRRAGGGLGQQRLGRRRATARRAGCRSSRATRTARSSCPAATSRWAWPAPSSTSSASPSRGCPACSTSPTRAPSHGASRTRWPTTRT